MQTGGDTVAEVKKGVSIQINRHWCKACGICIAFCPRQVYDQNPDGSPEAARPEDCIVCRQCEIRCPDLAIDVQGGGEDEHRG